MPWQGEISAIKKKGLLCCAVAINRPWSPYMAWWLTCDDAAAVRREAPIWSWFICTQVRGAHITGEMRAEATSSGTCQRQCSGEFLMFVFVCCWVTESGGAVQVRVPNNFCQKTRKGWNVQTDFIFCFIYFCNLNVCSLFLTFPKCPRFSLCLS